jgi:hypothetical protein
MAFKVQNMTVDPLNHQATIWALDQYDPTKPAKTINVQFPFSPLPPDGADPAKVIEAAKAVLQQALSEI